MYSTYYIYIQDTLRWSQGSSKLLEIISSSCKKKVFVRYYSKKEGNTRKRETEWKGKQRKIEELGKKRTKLE